MAQKDPSKRIIKAIFDLLDGNVTVGATTYPVYSFVPDDVGGGYIYIQDVQLLEASVKDRFMQSAAVTVQVVFPILGTSGSRVTIEDVSYRILSLVKTTVPNTLELGGNFNCVYLYTRSIRNFNEGPLEQGRYLRKVIEFALEVEQTD